MRIAKYNKKYHCIISLASLMESEAARLFTTSRVCKVVY